MPCIGIKSCWNWKLLQGEKHRMIIIIYWWKNCNLPSIPNTLPCIASVYPITRKCILDSIPKLKNNTPSNYNQQTSQEASSKDKPKSIGSLREEVSTPLIQWDSQTCTGMESSMTTGHLSLMSMGHHSSSSWCFVGASLPSKQSSWLPIKSWTESSGFILKNSPTTIFAHKIF